MDSAKAHLHNAKKEQVTETPNIQPFKVTLS